MDRWCYNNAGIVVTACRVSPSRVGANVRIVLVDLDKYQAGSVHSRVKRYFRDSIKV